MSWDTAIADVRTMISDGATDKLRWHKAPIGLKNSVNTIFKTFETRRISALVGANGNPLGVFNNYVLQTVTAEDLESGSFTLQTPPADGDHLMVTYYLQWFTDAEVTQFLQTACEWINGTDNYSSLDQGLWPAAKTFSAALSYQKLVSRYSANLAETYQLHDAPDKHRFDAITSWGKEADRLFKLAAQLRDDVYKNRKGQALAPISRVIRGRTRDVPPNR